MSSDQSTGAWQGVALLSAGILAFVLCLWLDLFAVLLALGCVIWRRWLGPLGRLGDAGYYLCWFVLTAWLPVQVALFGVHYSHLFSAIGYYVLGLLAWFALHSKFNLRPAGSKAMAIFMAISGTLLTGPSFLTPTVIFPMLAGIPLVLRANLTFGPESGGMYGWSTEFWSSTLLQLAVLLPAFLTVYWPKDVPGAQSTDAKDPPVGPPKSKPGEANPWL